MGEIKRKLIFKNLKFRKRVKRKKHLNLKPLKKTKYNNRGC